MEKTDEKRTVQKKLIIRLKNMDNDPIENNIAQKIFTQLRDAPNITKDGLDKILGDEINNANYLSEDWQINYAKERIKKIIDEKQLETVPEEQRVNFGSPGWLYIVLVLIGQLVIQYSKHPPINSLLFILGSLIETSSIYFFILLVAKLFYKVEHFFNNSTLAYRKKPKGFLLVKKISFFITVLTCLAVLFTLVIVTVGHNEAIKKANTNNATPTVIITSVKIGNDIIYPSMARLSDTAIQNTFNQGVKKIVDDEIVLFNTSVKEYADKQSTVSSTLQLSYQVVGQNTNYISVKFTGYAYIAGSAHGSNESFSYNFDLKRGREIQLADIFKPSSNYLQIISNYTIKELEQKNKTDFLQTGVLPKPQNFKVFNITDKGLLFSFGDYQVGSYAVGPQTVLVPFGALTNVSNDYFFTLQRGKGETL